MPIAADFQDVLFAGSTCFGCGPANPAGLGLRCRWADDRSAVVATWQPSPIHNNGDARTMNGGVLASLIDCHSAWAAIAFAHRAEGREVGEGEAILYVTAELRVRYVAPTPVSGSLQLSARVGGPIGRRVRVLCEVTAAGRVTATGDSTFVRIDAS